MSELGRRLGEGAVPGADAEERAWRLVHAAYLRRGPAPARRRWRGPAVVLAAFAAVLAVTPAGTGALELLREVAPPEAQPARSAVRPLTDLRQVPGGGRLLVLRNGSAAVIGAGTLPRRLGPAEDATFSAFGRYAATTHGRTLAVYAIDGRRVWSLRAPAAISSPAWAPDGLRVAYRAGARLHVVDGNGERAHDLARADGALVAWRPGIEPVVTYQREPHVIAFTHAATGTDLARVAAPRRAFVLRWSPDGRRMAVAGARELRIYSPGGALLDRRRPAPGRTYDGLAWSPEGRRLAVVVREGGREILRVGERILARGAFLTAPRWSPDGRWIVVSRGRERWSFFRADGGAVRHARGAAAIAGWTP